MVEGKIEQVEGRGQQHIVELRVEKVLHIGAIDSEKYPLSNAHLSSDFVRDYPQLAARTTDSCCRLPQLLVYGAN